MKKTRIISLFALVLSVSFLQAQKAKVVSAYNYNKAFERDRDCDDLKKGIESIESATKDEKTKDWAKTWFYGGNIYFNAMVDTLGCKENIDNVVDNVYKYYLTCLKYNIENAEAKSLDIEKEEDLVKLKDLVFDKETDFDDQSYTSSILNQRFLYLPKYFSDIIVKAFDSQDYATAKEYAKKSIVVNMFMKRVDSIGMYNAALASERLEQYDEAIEYCNDLIAVGFGGAELFLYKASIYDRQGDTVNKVKTIREGREAYPNNSKLITAELEYLIQTGQTDKALENFAIAIEAEPTNASLYFFRGKIYDDIGKIEVAAKDYTKALELDPEFYEAAFNLGAMYFNKGAEWNSKASAIPYSQKTKYKEATETANGFFRKAIPALEQAHAINPEDKETMATLVKIYAMLGLNDKYEAMKAKLQGN